MRWYITKYVLMPCRALEAFRRKDYQFGEKKVLKA